MAFKYVLFYNHQFVIITAQTKNVLKSTIVPTTQIFLLIKSASLRHVNWDGKETLAMKEVDEIII